MDIDVGYYVGSATSTSVIISNDKPLCFLYCSSADIRSRVVANMFNSFDDSGLTNIIYASSRGGKDSFNYCPALVQRYSTTKEAFSECSTIIKFAHEHSIYIPMVLLLDDIPSDRVSDARFKNDFLSVLRSGHVVGFKMIVLYSSGTGIMGNLVSSDWYTIGVVVDDTPSSYHTEGSNTDIYPIILSDKKGVRYSG
jgi:hypothetical protein